MPAHSDIVGASTRPLKFDIDARWLMAYAASLGDCNPRYMDTAAHRVIAHPLFPVALEWPVNQETPDNPAVGLLTPEEGARAVHATHDLHIYRPICAGDQLSAQGTIVSLRAIKAGAAMTSRLDTTDAKTGELVARTYQVGIFRDVAVEGGDRSCEEVPELPTIAAMNRASTSDIHVPAGASHLYTEGARIWNPIHTDRAVALEAGLPDIILHGTATLSLAVSRIVDLYADGDPTRVARTGGRCSAMVFMPSTLSLECQREDDVVFYQVRTEAGDLAISQGFVCLLPDAEDQT